MDGSRGLLNSPLLLTSQYRNDIYKNNFKIEREDSIINNIEFFLHMKKVPTVTHQQKKVTMVKGKPVFYEEPRLKAARAMFMNLLTPFKPEVMIQGKPIRLTTFWMYGTNDKKKIGTHKITKPDTDNSIKLLKDCMTEVGFWKDDALVSVNHIEKHWTTQDKAGIFVRIEVLEGK